MMMMTVKLSCCWSDVYEHNNDVDILYIDVVNVDANGVDSDATDDDVYIR